MRIILFQPCKQGIALKKELDLEFIPYPGLVIQETNPLRYSAKVEKVRYDIPTGKIVADMTGRLDEPDVEYLKQEGWKII